MNSWYPVAYSWYAQREIFNRVQEKMEGGKTLSIAYREVYLAANDEQGYTRADIYKRLSAETPEFAGAKEI
jgi:hypothetical protein